MVIKDVLARDLSRRIEEIIKVDQTDDDAVYSELTEYIATDRIKNSYRTLLREIAEAPKEPHEGVGIWVSGFFGSGKSSFAKNLGYVLSHKSLKGTPAGKLFAKQVDDPRIGEWIEFINTAIPTRVVMFDVQVDHAVRKATEPIAEIMYTVLLRELGYAEDFDVAELEIELEREHKLDDFAARCEAKGFGDWKMVRKGAQKLSRASAILHDMDPQTYPTPDSWSHGLRDKRADITVGRFVARAFELCQERCRDQALVFIIDEVGQYVARSEDKIENLRAVVEQFGREGVRRLKAGEAVAPVWIVVTSQEKLEEVVAAIDSRRVELAKLQDRFPDRLRVDLVPSDIRDVATQRVLAKTVKGERELRRLYGQNQGQLRTACRLERTSRQSDVTEDEFVQFYPYLPHYIDLSIDIMSGMRLRGGAMRQLGGSNRTIIKQAYEMLVSERTHLADQPVGTLVTLDRVFDLVEGPLGSEAQKDISDVAERLGGEDGGMAVRVAKVICLLELVRDLPRTAANIAACLVDEVGQGAPREAVERALERLGEAQFARETEEGWKLQTAREKNWEAEKRNLSPKPRDRHEVLREMLRELFGDPKLRQYRYRDLTTFRVGVSMEGHPLSDEGQVPLEIVPAEDQQDLVAKLDVTRNQSREESQQDRIHWVFPLSAEADGLTAQLYASRQMVAKYDQLRAQNKITPEEASCLQDERGEALRLQTRLRDRLRERLLTGAGIFRGVSRDGADLGKTDAEVFRALFDLAVPDLYPKLEVGACRLRGGEAEALLKAADLKAVPEVLYRGEGRLGLVAQDGAKLVIDASAPVAKEVLDYLVHEHSYGNRETRTGKAVEGRFAGVGYGWEREVLQLVLAALFRAGAVDVTYQGTQFRNYQDPASRAPFTNLGPFRAALFSPREALGLKALTTAVEQLEDLTGEEVDVEEGAIATAFQRVANEELERLYPLRALAEAHRLPVVAMLDEYQQTLQGIRSSASDDCVRTLVEAGAAFAVTRTKVRRLRETLNDEALSLLQDARAALQHVWPQLRVRGPAEDVAAGAEELEVLLAPEDLPEVIVGVARCVEALLGAFRAAYADLFDRRASGYAQAIDDVKGRPEWGALAGTRPEVAASVLEPLQARIGSPEERVGVIEGAGWRSASLLAMESDLAAVEALRAAALARLQEMALGDATERPVRRVRIADILARPIHSKDDLDAAIEQLRDALQKFIDEGDAIILE